MKIVASAAVSSDGYMDDTSSKRLVLSGKEDWEEVYSLRAECDAILVGAETVRRDNPSLVIRDASLRSERLLHGMKPDIVKVVVTGSGRLAPSLRFFTEGKEADKIVITSENADRESLERLPDAACIVTLPDITAQTIAEALAGYGIRLLMVEGGAKVLKMFIDADMVDTLRLALSPIKVEDPAAPRFPYFGAFTSVATEASRRVRRVGNMTVYEYDLHSPSDTVCFADRLRLWKAIEISESTIPCDTCYRVGCVIATVAGKEYIGYTHETGPHNHAEEEAVKKALSDGADLRGSTVYSSMEPCSTRRSKPISCSELIIGCGVRKVVYAYAEPDCFVCCEGSRLLREAGIEVVEAKEFAPRVKELNSHILKRYSDTESFRSK